jgi:hypothetical protein
LATHSTLSHYYDTCIIKSIVIGNRPKLHELQLLKFTNGPEFRIIEKVAPKWDEVAIALGFDGARIETIKMGAYYQPAQACREMFIEWLGGGHDLEPPTWNVLIQSLRIAKLTENANFLSRSIEIVSFVSNIPTLIIPFSNNIQEVEDGGASIVESVDSISSTVAVNTEYRVASSTGTLEDVISGNGIPCSFCLHVV